MLHGAVYLLTPVNSYSKHNLITFHNSFYVELETTFLISPHMFSSGLKFWALANHSITLILLAWNQDAAHLLVFLCSLSCLNTHYDGISSLAYCNMTPSIFLSLQIWPTIPYMQKTSQYEKSPQTLIQYIWHHASQSLQCTVAWIQCLKVICQIDWGP